MLSLIYPVFVFICILAKKGQDRFLLHTTMIRYRFSQQVRKRAGFTKWLYDHFYKYLQFIFLETAILSSLKMPNKGSVGIHEYVLILTICLH